jgi:hypothetical protein
MTARPVHLDRPAAAGRLRAIAELPSPKGVPALGNMLQIKPGTMHQTLERWAAELGPLYRFRIGRREFMVVGDHEVFSAALRDRPTDFAARR